MSISGSLPEVGELSSTADPKVRTLLNELKTEVNAQGELQHAVHWYEPKIIATEQTRENTGYGSLATPDTITGVVVPANGVIRIGYLALWKSSVDTAGRATIFVNSTAVGTLANGSGGASPEGHSSFRILSTDPISASGAALVNGAELSSLSTLAIGQPWLDLPVTAGTYEVTVKYAATSGSVTAKERHLWVEVHGV